MNSIMPSNIRDFWPMLTIANEWHWRSATMIYVRCMQT
jgi:hypothetical protein